MSARHPLDAMVRAAEHHGLLLENDRVRVLDARLAPGERSAVHGHEWPAAMYVLSYSDFIRYDPAGNVLLDSRTLGRRPQRGEAIWSGPIEPHSLENVGTTDLHVIAVEIKP
jgi:quercetin dioxygenase-like cupin family protein